VAERKNLLELMNKPFCGELACDFARLADEM
jgi:hypothetical protein